MLRIVACLVLAQAVSAPAQAAEFQHDRFKPATLSALQADENELIALHPGNRPGGVVVHPPARARVLATFTGQHRPIDAPTTKFIGQYATSMQAQAAWAPSFREEYLFQSDGHDWWFPAQAQVAAYFAGELKPGDPVNLYLVAVGSVRADDGWRPMFFLEDFQTPTNTL